MSYYLFDLMYGLLVSVIDTIIYSFVEITYNIFVVICKIDIFNNGSESARLIYDSFTTRIYTILSLLMIFFFAYELIMFIVDPDKDTKSSTGIIKNTVTSVIMIAVGPILFRYMAVLQSHIVDENTMFSIVLGKGGAGNKNVSPGKELSMMLLMSFLHPRNMDYSSFVVDGWVDSSECDAKGSNHICHYFVDHLLSWQNEGGGVKYITVASSEIKKQAIDFTNGSVEWLPVVDVIAGAVILWFLIGYVFDVAVRAIKLAFLEIVSPIFFAMRIFPKTSKNFDSWREEIIKTYLELFAKIALLAFVIELCTLVPDIIEALWASTGNEVTGFARAIAVFSLIVGLFTFAKQLPELLKKMVSSGMFAGVNFKPGLKSRAEATQAVGKVGAIGSGMFGGLAKGLYDSKGQGVSRYLANGFRGMYNGAVNGAKMPVDKLGFLGISNAKKNFKGGIAHWGDENFSDRARARGKAAWDKFSEIKDNSDNIPKDLAKWATKRPTDAFHKLFESQDISGAAKDRAALKNFKDVVIAGAWGENEKKRADIGRERLSEMLSKGGWQGKSIDTMFGTIPTSKNSTEMDVMKAYDKLVKNEQRRVEGNQVKDSENLKNLILAANKAYSNNRGASYDFEKTGKLTEDEALAKLGFEKIRQAATTNDFSGVSNVSEAEMQNIMRAVESIDRGLKNAALHQSGNEAFAPQPKKSGDDKK